MSSISNHTPPLSPLSPVSAREADASIQTCLQRLEQSLDAIEACLAALEAVCYSDSRGELDPKALAEELDELQRGMSRDVSALVGIVGGG